MKRKFRSFTDAREFVRKLKLKNRTEWIKAYRDGKIPKHLPAKPWKTYSKKRIK